MGGRGCRGWARRGWSWHGGAVMARPVSVWTGEARLGGDRPGLAVVVRRRLVCHGKARLSRLVSACRGAAGLGGAWLSGQVPARRGQARRGSARRSLLTTDLSGVTKWTSVTWTLSTQSAISGCESGSLPPATVPCHRGTAVFLRTFRIAVHDRRPCGESWSRLERRRSS